MRPANRGPARRRPPVLRSLGAERPVRLRAEVATYLTARFDTTDTWV